MKKIKNAHQRHILEPISNLILGLSYEYKRKLKPDKDDLVIQKNHNGTIKIITSM